MANEKMTKREWFNAIKVMVEGSDVENKEGMLSFIAHEVELLDRKHSKSGETKTQKENKVIMETVYEVLKEKDSAVTVSELMNDERMAGYSNQKLSALLRIMVKEGKAKRIEEKKKAYFSAV